MIAKVCSAPQCGAVIVHMRQKARSVRRRTPRAQQSSHPALTPGVLYFPKLVNSIEINHFNGVTLDALRMTMTNVEIYFRMTKGG